jgi:EAL and modified HD-GYP domain-containing signal transduction protein
MSCDKDHENSAVWVARQSVLNSQYNVVAHEILYRGSPQALTADHGMEGAAATRQVIRNIVFGIGLDKFLSGARGLLNIPEELLADPVLEALPANQISLEILETVQPTAEALRACAGLRKAGFSLFLDDYSGQPHLAPFLDLVDCVKVDLRKTTPQELEKMCRWFHSRGIKALAEKVETHEEFDRCRSFGFDLYQGFFLDRPVLVRGEKLPAIRMQRMELLRFLVSTEFDWDELEAILSRNPVLAYQLIRHANSARYNQLRRVDSLRRCLTVLGEIEARRMLLLLTLLDVAGTQIGELVRRCVIRARMMELLAASAAGEDGQKQSAFLTGLFSSIDLIIGAPFEELAPHLGLSGEIESAIRDQGGNGLLGELLKLVKAYEKGDWSGVDVETRSLGVSAEGLSTAYLEAVSWLQTGPAG